MIHFVSHAYIGPGAGFAFLGSLLSLISAVLASIASAAIWPFRVLRSLLLRPKRTPFKKAIFLGFDGLDPVITEKLMAEGRLPNLARLRAEGSYRRLRTPFPALSAAAWSTFATGDLHTHASTQTRPKSEPFWKILGRHAVPSTILRVPANLPLEPFAGRQLSCERDLPGTPGTYSRFTSLEGKLTGPQGTSLPFRVRAGQIEIQGQSYPLPLHDFTPWARLKFGRIHGIVRFLLTQTEPTIDLYATPVQIDPEKPAVPISHPAFYATYLARLLGTYSTLRLAEDTRALNEGAIGPDDFLHQAKLIQKEREAIFFSALDHTRRGVVACVFDTSDRVQQMFPGQPEIIEPLYCDMDRIVGKALRHVDASTAFFVLSNPGVLFSNLKITADNPGIEDLAPTALSLFGVEVPAEMEGRALLAPA
jgi:hypothetical protein